MPKSVAQLPRPFSGEAEITADILENEAWPPLETVVAAQHHIVSVKSKFLSEVLCEGRKLGEEVRQRAIRRLCGFAYSAFDHFLISGTPELTRREGMGVTG